MKIETMAYYEELSRNLFALCWLLKVWMFEAGLQADLYNWTLENEDVPFIVFL